MLPLLLSDLFIAPTLASRKEIIGLQGYCSLYRRLVVLGFAPLFALFSSAVFAADDVPDGPMWNISDRWECAQVPIEAACAGPLGERCRVDKPRRTSDLYIDFTDRVVVTETSTGKGYVPITAKTMDRKDRVSTLLFGESGGTVMQFSNGQAYTSALPPGGGIVQTKFYSCAPVVPE